MLGCTCHLRVCVYGCVCVYLRAYVYVCACVSLCYILNFVLYFSTFISTPDFYHYLHYMLFFVFLLLRMPFFISWLALFYQSFVCCFLGCIFFTLSVSYVYGFYTQMLPLTIWSRLRSLSGRSSVLLFLLHTLYRLIIFAQSLRINSISKLLFSICIIREKFVIIIYS